MIITLDLNKDEAALLCGTLMRAANQYPDSPNQQILYQKAEVSVDAGWNETRNTRRPASDRVVEEIKERLPKYASAEGDLAVLMCADIYFLLNERAALSLRDTTDECS